MSLLWINGTLIEKAEARISPFDHGLLYGDGAWEPLRLFGGKPFAAEQHLRNLDETARAVGIDLPLALEDLIAAIDATAKANNRMEGYVRVLVTRGPGTIGPDPRKIEPQVIVIAEEYQPFPHELYGHGVNAVVSPLTLDPANPAHRFRTLNQLHIVVARRHALQHGCLEALLQGQQGGIVGATEGHLLAVAKGVIVVGSGQPADATGTTVATLAAHAGRVIEERTLMMPELRAADEVFIAGTACGVIGVVSIDGTVIGTGTEGPVTRDLRARFDQLTHNAAG